MKCTVSCSFFKSEIPSCLEQSLEFSGSPTDQGELYRSLDLKKTAWLLKEMFYFGNKHQRNWPPQSGPRSFTCPHLQRRVIKINRKLAWLFKRQGQPPSLKDIRTHSTEGVEGVSTSSKAMKSRTPFVSVLSGRLSGLMCIFHQDRSQSKPLSKMHGTKPS